MASSAVLVSGSLIWGPLEWGRRLAWEPEPNKKDPQSVSSLPNADLERDRVYSWDRAGVARTAAGTMLRARPLFLRALENHPDDRDTLIGGGTALLEHGSGDGPLVLEAWRSYLRRHPGDAEIEAALSRILFR
jgi:hypothetical protein